MDTDYNWSLGTIVYHIYPRSFQDTDGDGIGDLKGITSRLNYLAHLGVNAIWLSPIYPSPQKDFGYDVTDHENIDPIFGSLEMFDRLIEEAHHRGIRVIMDYIPNHTSDQHPWFQVSKSNLTSPKRDWYIWADGKSDGSPPNNWLSVFGGSAWEHDKKTGQYYLHTFAKEQPDLNWHNLDVEKRMLDVLRFWMDHGVDGFRVDSIDHLIKDVDFADEPSNSNYTPGEKINPFERLLHVFTKNQPKSYEMMKKMVEVLKERNGKFIVSEAYTEAHQIINMYKTVGWKWYQPFNFSLIDLPWNASSHKDFVDEYDRLLENAYFPSYVLGNHDQNRAVSRIGPEQARNAALLHLTLRGIPFIYYGDEIGMENGDIPYDLVVDPKEINNPGLGLGRDPARTPMQWDANPNAGFTAGKPWLPVNKNFKKQNVELQENDPMSMISLYRLLIKLRKHHHALSEGSYTPLPYPAENVLAYIRESGDEKILVLINFDEKEKGIKMEFQNAHLLCDSGLTDPEDKKFNLSSFTLRGNEGYMFLLKE